MSAGHFSHLVILRRVDNFTDRAIMFGITGKSCSSEKEPSRSILGDHVNRERLQFRSAWASPLLHDGVLGAPPGDDFGARRLATVLGG